MLSRYGNCFSLIELHQPFHRTDSLNACCRGNKFHSRICTPACITTWISGYTCTWVRHSQSCVQTHTHTYMQTSGCGKAARMASNTQVCFIDSTYDTGRLALNLKKNQKNFELHTLMCCSLLRCIQNLGWFPRRYVKKFNYLGITRTVERSDVSAGITSSAHSHTPYLSSREYMIYLHF